VSNKRSASLPLKGAAGGSWVDKGSDVYCIEAVSLSTCAIGARGFAQSEAAWCRIGGRDCGLQGWGSESASTSTCHHKHVKQHQVLVLFESCQTYIKRDALLC
jgi:hypothetical protein